MMITKLPGEQSYTPVEKSLMDKYPEQTYLELNKKICMWKI